MHTATALCFLAWLPSAALGAGCYLGASGRHICECHITAVQCSALNYTWTSQCCQAFPPPSPAPPPDCVPDHGCYDVHGSHSCDCKITKSQCNAGAGIWTTGCGCDHSGDPGYHPEACNHTKSDFGCYNAKGLHQCDCHTDESTCVNEGGSWITGCSCVAEAAPPPSPSPPPLPRDGGVVTATLQAECPAATYQATFVRANMLDSLATLTAVARHYISISVSDRCDTPWGSSALAYAELTLEVACGSVSHVLYVEAAVQRALVDEDAASSALKIRVIGTPRVESDINYSPPPPPRPKKWSSGQVAGVGIGAALASSLLVGVAVYKITKRSLLRPERPMSAPILAGAAPGASAWAAGPQ